MPATHLPQSLLLTPQALKSKPLSWNLLSAPCAPTVPAGANSLHSKHVATELLSMRLTYLTLTLSNPKEPLFLDLKSLMVAPATTQTLSEEEVLVEVLPMEEPCGIDTADSTFQGPD